MFLLVFLSLLLAGPAMATGQDEADMYFRQGRWALSAQAYAQRARENPSPDTLKRLALSQLYADEFEASYETWQKVRDNYPDDTDADMNLRLLDSIREQKTARLDEVAARYADNPAFHRVSGIANMWLKRPDEALGHLKRAVTLDPGDYMSWFYKGLIYELLEDFDNSIKAYTKAVELNPVFAQALNNLGYSYKEKHFYSFAIIYYRKAIEINPENAGYHYNIGNAYTQKDMIDEAYESYKKALELDPQFAKAHYNMGRTYLRYDRLREAVEEFRLYLKYWTPDIPLADAPPPDLVAKEIKSLEEEIRETEQAEKSPGGGR